MTNMRTGRKNEVLKYRIISILIVLGFVAIIFTVNYFGGLKTESVIREEVGTLLSSSSSFGGKNPAIGGRIHVRGLGQRYGFIFNAGNRNDLIFVIPLTDSAGPVLSVFYYKEGSGISFIGNCCQPSLDGNYNKNTVNHEISPGVLKNWTLRLSNIANRIKSGRLQNSTGDLIQ